MLVRTRSVLSLVQTENDVAWKTFEHPVEDGDALHGRCEVQLTKEAWEELGSPEQITVDIEPGDRLNP
jgi:hypothetical protein